MATRPLAGFLSMLGLLSSLVSISGEAAAQQPAFMPYSAVNTSNCAVGGIALGLDLATYFSNAVGCGYFLTPPSTNRLGRIDRGGSLQWLSVPSDIYPMFLSAAPDGSIWFTGAQVPNPSTSPGVVLGRVDKSGTVTTFPLGSNGSPGPITVGPGQLLWFLWIENSGAGIMHLASRNTDTGAMTDSTVPEVGYVKAMKPGPDGNLWFTSSGSQGPVIVRVVFAPNSVTPGPVSEFRPSNADDYQGLAAGPDGAMWASGVSFTKGTFDVIRLANDGHVLGRRLLHDKANIAGSSGALVVGQDGNMWMSEDTKIVRIAMDGTVTDFPAPNAVWPEQQVNTQCGLEDIGALTGPLAVGAITVKAIQLWVGLESTYDCVGETPGSVLPPNFGAIDRVEIPGSPKQRIRPIPMGVMVGNTPAAQSGAGTAGLVVAENGNSNFEYLLGNSHVLGAQGTPGCPDSGLVGHTKTLQPGPQALGSDPGDDPFYVVGTVAKIWPFGATNRIDAAISRLKASVFSTDIAGIGAAVSTIGTPSRGEAVVKSGASSGVTVGTVVADNVAINVPYPHGCGTFRFTDQFAIAATGAFFSLPGDSGAAILDAATHEPVGLLMSGNGFIAYANKMSNVAAILGIAPVGSSASPAATTLLPAGGAMSRRLKAIQARHEDAILALPGVQAIGIERAGETDSFVVYGAHWSTALAQELPRTLEGVPVRFEAIGSVVGPGGG